MYTEVTFFNEKDFCFFIDVLNKGKINFVILESGDIYYTLRFKCAESTIKNKYAKLLKTNTKCMLIEYGNMQLFRGGSHGKRNKKNA